MKKLKLKWLKWRLRKAYELLLSMRDGADCGCHLLRHISSEFADQENKVNDLYDKCQEMEKQCSS